MIIYERRAYYHETDQMGVIHHANYFKWMEEARIHFLDELGLSYKKMEEIGIISPIISVGAEYKKSVYFDDIAEIKIFINKYNGIKLDLSYEIYNKTKGYLAIKANSVRCFLKDGNIISLKREYPHFDEVLNNYKEKSDNNE